MTRHRRRGAAPARCPRVGCPSSSHDTYSAWKYGCTSPAAEADRSRYFTLYRAGHRPRARRPVGPSARRLQALAAGGWDAARVAERAGLHRATITAIRAEDGRYTTVDRATADAIDAVFRALWDRPGPSRRAQAIAAARHWHPAAAFDDIDNMRERPKLGSAARVRSEFDPDTGAEVRRRSAWGHPISTIARDLGITTRSVERHRAAARPDDTETAAS
jgi:hypothetical protein